MRLPFPWWFCVLLLSGLGLPAQAEVAYYRIDPVHTRIMLAVDHAGFSHAMGTVSGSTGTLEFDPDDWRSARLDVSVPVQRLDFGDPAWNRAVLGRRLLDGEGHPQARFVSTGIEAIDADHAVVHGELTLRGQTRPVTLQVTRNGLRRHPLPPFRRTAGFSATGQLSRAAFGIDAWPNVIGDTVELRLEVEATRGRAPTGRDEHADAIPAPVPASSTEPSQ